MIRLFVMVFTTIVLMVGTSAYGAVLMTSANPEARRFGRMLWLTPVYMGIFVLCLKLFMP